MNENNKKYLVELHGTRDLTKWSYLRANGIKKIADIGQEITPNTSIRHNFSVNNRNIIENMKDDTTIHVVSEIELEQGTHVFSYSNTDNYGWDVVLSLNNEEVFQTKKGTNFNVKVRVGQRTIRPKMQGIKRIKSKTRMKLSGFQFGVGKLRERIQIFGKNNQVSEAENIQTVQQQAFSQKDEYADFVQDEPHEEKSAWQKYTESLNFPHIKKARDQQKKGRLGLFQK